MFTSQSPGFDQPSPVYRRSKSQQPRITAAQAAGVLTVRDAERTFRQTYSNIVIDYRDHPMRDRPPRLTRRIPQAGRLSRLHPGLAPPRVRLDNAPVLFAPVDISPEAQKAAIAADLERHLADCERRRRAAANARR